MAQKQTVLRMEGITKHFSKVTANRNVSLEVRSGEILALLGENGCGKTTLMNIIAGIYYPDEGRIFVGDNEVVIRSPRDAYRYKIGMVHQHFKLVDIFTAAENIVLGMSKSEGGDLKKADRSVSEIADRYGFTIDPKKKIYDMSVSEKQTVEIIKVLYRGADILILDEPTAVLTLQETKKLFDVLRRMRDDGKSVIIITHKLNEVLEVSDRITIMRKGEHVGTVDTKDATESMLTEMMVGKKISLDIERSLPENDSVRLSLSHLNAVDQEGMQVLRDVSFDVYGGEILGIAGIAGSGQKELLESVAGLQPLTGGDIIFNSPKKNKPVTYFHKSYRRVCELAAAGAFHYASGERVDFSGLSRKEIMKRVEEGDVLFNEDEVMDLRNKTPREIRNLGVHLSFVPEDRLGMGLVGSMGVSDNMMLRSYRKGKGVLLERTSPRQMAERIISELSVVTPGIKTPVKQLSGGNVQKVLVGREIASSPRVLMAAYPVRGLDINSSYMIYNLLNRQKENGAAVIFVGEDLDVLMGLCDRILVMNGGRVTGIVDARTVTKEELGYLMTKSADEETKEGNTDAEN